MCDLCNYGNSTGVFNDTRSEQITTRLGSDSIATVNYRGDQGRNAVGVEVFGNDTINREAVATKQDDRINALTLAQRLHHVADVWHARQAR